MTIHIQETYINRTVNSMIGESEVYDTGRNENEKGGLFRDLQREYGRCKGKVYIDTTDGNTKAIGWVFEGRDKYEDVPEESYLREVWVSLHDAPPTQTVEYHYLAEES
jgi:hypothetical protein